MIHHRIRGKRPTKCYVAVFVCFVTKAVHMEVVSDLTAESFIGALRRFMSRRGICQDLYCDNATNFVGAKNILKKEADEYAEILSMLKINEKEIIRRCQEQGVQFHFIPPRSPHFGGLWEAAVKSAKKLIKKIVLSAALTFEELSTVIAEAEAILNSRPVSSISSDPNDLVPLTPGHFLIGEPLTSIPDPNLEYKLMSNLSRWRLVSAIRKEFWKRWTREYLHELQTRSKWTNPNTEVVPGMMVLVKDDNQTSLKWPLGRIQEVVPGKDNLIRVAVVKTANGIYKRALTNLAPLPIEVENSDTVFHEPDTPKVKRPLHADSFQNNATKAGRKLKNNRKRNSHDVEKQIPNSSASQKRQKYSCHTTLIFVILLMLPLIVLGHNLPFEVTQLQNNVGVYINKIGTSNIIKTNWNMIVFCNMTGYWKNLNMLHDGVKKLKKLANISDDVQYLNLINSEYDHQLLEIANDNQLLFNKTSPTKRRKRGVVNGVGYLANILFGILDDDDAKRISEAINNVTNDQKYLFNLMKNQTSIVEATNKLIKDAHQGYMDNFHKIHQELAEVVDHINDAAVSIKKQKVVQTLTIFSQYVQVSLFEFKKSQDRLIKMITDIHHNQITPVILSPMQLSDHLEEIRSMMPIDLKLPTLSQLYGMMSVKCKVNKQFAVFAFQIPLLSSTEVDLIQLISYPVMINKVYMKLDSIVEYLLINKHRDEIYQLSKLDYQACFNPHEGYFICNQERPFHTLAATQFQCEFQLLKEQKIADKCHFKIFSPRRTWIQMSETNNWLFSLSNDSVYNIVCNDESYQIKLHGAGILSFTNDCVLRENDLIIQSYKSRTFKFELTFQPELIISEDIRTSISKLKLENLKNFTDHSFITEYGKIQGKINHLMEEENYSLSGFHQDIHQYVLSYGAVMCLVICISLFLIKIICNYYQSRRRRSNPVTLTMKDFVVDVPDINRGKHV